MIGFNIIGAVTGAFFICPTVRSECFTRTVDDMHALITGATNSASPVTVINCDIVDFDFTIPMAADMSNRFQSTPV